MREKLNSCGDMSQSDHETVNNPTRCRLIDALLKAWANSAGDAVSVRALVQQAGAAHSAIHYHFGNIERLYVATSQAALIEAERWMAERLTQMAALEGTALPWPLQASILTSTIADWTGTQRRLAMAERYAPSAQWEMAWDDFWYRTAGLLGLGEHATTLAAFAAGETRRHLLIWHPALDRALLEETVAALLLWLTQRTLAGDRVRPVHRHLAAQAYRRPAMQDDALADPIAHAAADLLAECGHSGVTFRAVAGRAAVTLGKVIHVYGTKSELLHAALHCLYEREALSGNRESFVAQSFPPEVMLDHLMGAISGGDQPVLRAYDEIERAIYNGSEHAALRGVVRSMDDPSGTWALRQLLGGVLPPGSLVAAFSAIIRGVGGRASVGTPEAGTRSAMRGAFGAFIGPIAPAQCGETEA